MMTDAQMKELAEDYAGLKGHDYRDANLKQLAETFLTLRDVCDHLQTRLDSMTKARDRAMDERNLLIARLHKLETAYGKAEGRR